ncbi:MAG: hypothetical protein K6G10_07775, partial [Butyrivibrio sp.]|nr:hypothetical protein [Butyrivibrio sp.]
ASGFENENFMVSPTSFRAALALAVAGADGETKDALIKAMGFESMEDVNSWYASVLESVDNFDKWFEYEDDPSAALKIMNSVWSSSEDASFKEDYKKYVEDNYRAEARFSPKDRITKEVDDWVNEGTNGLIPSLGADLSASDLVLVNTLFLKTSWISTFEEYDTMEDDFKTFDGSVVKKDFMEKTDDYLYYEDDGCKLVSIPMNGRISAVFVLGDAGDVSEKLEKAQIKKVHLRIPKFETESSFDGGLLVNFLKAKGAAAAFSDDADFSDMADLKGTFISDIIQKTKIKTDESGIEAAAVTAVMLVGSALMEEPEPIMEFVADEPFKYMILAGNDEGADEALFIGQLVK